MIRRATGADFQELLEIWKDAVSATHDFLLKNDFEAICSQLPVYFSAVNLYVFEEKGSACGFLGIHEDKIEMLFVRNRGEGVGKKLLLFAIDCLNCTQVDVNTQNISALQFYLHCGFSIFRESPVDSEGRPYPVTHLKLK